MAKVTDEMLMAYADGALAPLARAKVEAFLQNDPEARRRVEIFRATGAPLSKLYGQPMSEPVPAHLRDFVLNYDARAATPKAQLSKMRLPTEWMAKSLAGFAQNARLLTASLAQWLEKPPSQTVRWQFAAASAAILAVGAGAGILMHGGGNASSELVAFEDGHIFASGALQRVLETLPSGEEARIAGVRGQAVSMRANLTFKSKQQAYCREYEVATPGVGGFVGLGCRDRDGKWALEVHLPAGGSAKGGVRPAGGAENAALDEVVDHMIDGDAFGSKQEDAAIGSGWK